MVTRQIENKSKRFILNKEHTYQKLFQRAKPFIKEQTYRYLFETLENVKLKRSRLKIWLTIICAH
jgi:hypothetical protein